MIESITLENWKTHKASTLRFGKGTNVLVGVIGSGKSSVMDGLCYGLFGTFPAVQNRRVSVSDLLMRKPFVADQGRVEVCFRVGDQNYRVERILKRDGINEGRLWCNDTLIAGPKPNQVTERVEKELNVTYELFTRAVYSEQNQVDYFLKLNPGDRKKKFDELLELQKYEGVRSNAMQIVNQFRKQEEQHAQSLSQFDAVLQNQDLNELRLNVSLQAQKMASLASQKDTLTLAFQDAKARALVLEERLAKANALKEKIQRLEAQRDTLRGRMDTLAASFSREEVPSHSSLESEKKSLAEKWASLSQRQDARRTAEAAVQKSSERVRGLESRLQDLSLALASRSPESIQESFRVTERALVDARSAYEACQKEASSRLAALRVVEQQIQLLASEEKDLSSLHASCPTCKQAISSDHKSQIAAALFSKKALLDRAREDAVANVKENDASRGKLEHDYPLLESALRSLSLAQEKAKEWVSVQGELRTAQDSLHSAQSTLSSLGNASSSQEMEQIQSRLAILDRGLEFHSILERTNGLSAEIVRGQAEFSSLGVSQEQVVQAVQARSECQSALGNLDKELALEKKIADELSARVKGVEQVVAQQQVVRAKRDRAADVQQSLSVFANVLIETQQQLRETVVGAINAALGELWPWVYPYKDFSLAKVLIQDNDYVLTVQERNGHWVSAESSLSGGERSAAALALRMAIAFVLTRQLSWVILDEPTHNLDSKSVATLSEVLRTRLPELVDQVFVITHASEIEKSATGSLYVLQRDKNEDGITIPLNKLDLGMRPS